MIAAVPILAIPLILNPCVVGDERKEIEDRHTETRQYEQNSVLVGHAANKSVTNTSTMGTTNHFHFPEQFT
jgi:hypothetical protein